MAVNGFLVLMNFLTGMEYFWAAWPILGWGIALAIHFGVAYFKNSSAYVTEFENWKAFGAGANPGQVNPSLVIGVALGSKKDSEG